MNREGKFFVSLDVILNIDNSLPGLEVGCLNSIGVPLKGVLKRMYLRLSAANDWFFLNDI